MGNRIVISESQYGRLFLGEQELPPSFKKGLDKDKQLNLNDPNGLEGWLKNGQVDDEKEVEGYLKNLPQYGTYDMSKDVFGTPTKRKEKTTNKNVNKDLKNLPQYGMYDLPTDNLGNVDYSWSNKEVGNVDNLPVKSETACNSKQINYCKRKNQGILIKNFSGKELNSLLPNQPVPWTDSEKYPICVCGDERTKMSDGSDYDDKYLQQKREESYKTDIKRMLMMSGTITDFEKWVRDWTSQDWVDALSIVLYLIPTPLTWGIATALEVGNAGISVGKGNYGEAALRAGFLIGGFGLSKLLGSTFKASRKSADEVVSVFKKLGGKSNKEIIDFIKLERKSMSKEAKKLLDDITKQVGKDGGDKLFNFAKKK